VTDADLLLGRIASEVAFPGVGVLDAAAARAACKRAGVDPAGVVAVADAHMTGAIRRVTVERGVDPRGLALVAFGGAGPLHACALADALGMAAVIVPPRAGVLSAAGILAAPVARELVHTWATPHARDGLDAFAQQLAHEAQAEVGRDAVVETAFDCRYAGQSHELTVATVGDFEAEHLRVNGHVRAGHPVEVVAVRARASLASPVAVLDLPVPAGRVGGVGPMVIAEPDCTIWVPSGWKAELGEAGALVLRRTT
jgi:N-methylhydantoinase A/oxoprolinase/acetone carboxylase beta subunit